MKRRKEGSPPKGGGLSLKGKANQEKDKMKRRIK
jgi:hypothetical protein